MPDSTPITTAPALPDGTTFYDAIMREIEPELTSDQLALLEERSAADTPEQKAERQARYKAAFEVFDRRFDQEMTTLERQVHTFKSESQKQAELANRQKEQVDMAALESSILAA